MENLGQALDWVRRNRNMTIETLCEGVMSPSSYSRFVNGKTFVSSKSFMTLIFRLNMTFAMFLQDYHNFFQNRHDYALLIHAQAYEDTEMLSALLETYAHQKQEQNKEWNNFDERLLKVTAALLDQLQESPDAATSLEAAKLDLATLSHFTDNDFTAFHLLLPYLTLTEADEILQVPLGKVTNLQEPALPEGLYHVCGDLFTHHLIADNVEQAEFYYQKLTEIYIDPADFNWKISRKIHQSIWQYFTSDKDLACQNLQRLIEFYGELELLHLQEKNAPNMSVIRLTYWRGDKMNDLTTKQSVVEELRKRKGFSMSEICGDYVSHSSYSRFINHQQLMSIDKLMYILKQMDLSFREATLFDHVIQAANEDWLLMERLLKEGELTEMMATVERFEAASYREYDAYGMMAIQIRLKIGGEVAEEQIASLKKYLFQVHNWTYKEMYLFTFILDKVSTQIILLRVRRAFQRAADPYYLERNLNLIILLEAAHLELLKRQELTAAQETFDKLDQLYVNKAYIGQQAFRAINRLIHELVTDEKPDTLTRLEALYHNFLLCEADFLALRLKSRYTALQAVYQLPDLTLEQ